MLQEEGNTIMDTSNTDLRELTTREIEAVSGGYPTGPVAVIAYPVLTEEIGYPPSPVSR
jgi:hypothetical protein